jgi:hypothetical protein
LYAPRLSPIRVTCPARLFRLLWNLVGTLYTHKFRVQSFFILPTQCIYVFCVDLRTNSGYFPIQH